MANDQPPPVPGPRPEGPRRATVLPLIITVLVAVGLSLLAQALLNRLQADTPTLPISTATVASSVALTPTAALLPPTASPAPTVATGDGLLRLAIIDLQAEQRRLWSAIYLLRAATQIDDALIALQGNEQDEADRILLTVYRSLDRAYRFSAEQEKGPIDTFRLQVSQIRDDIRLRPEGLDRRLRQLRSLILSLVDEGGEDRGL